MMRDLESLKSKEFDILVIGGGIHGATVAYEAATRCYKTALIEMGDFGSATSANSLKVIHGGLRYLQHANFPRIRQSIHSRKIFHQIAPHLITNVPFLVPTYGHGIKSKFVMKTAIAIYDLLSIDRNKNIPPENHIPGGKTISKNEIKNIIPGIDSENLTGGAVWYESISNDSERLILEFILQAAERGAEVYNYVKANDLIFEEKNITGANVTDLITDEQFNIRAKFTIIAAGPWLNRFVPKQELHFPLTKAVNIVVKKNLFGKYAVGLESAEEYEDKDALIKRGKRLYFFVPLRGKTMIGTTYKKYSENPDDLKITRTDIEEILEEVNKINPAINLNFDDVSFYHVGLLPMEPLVNPEDDIQPGKHSKILDSENVAGLKGGIFIKSVKFTTAPSIAEETLKLIDKKFGKNTERKKQKIDARNSQIENLSKPDNIPEDYINRLKKVYGNKRYYKIIDIINENHETAELLSTSPPVTKAEIIYVIKNEFAVKLQDIILRRTGLGNLEIPSSGTILKIAGVVQKELNYSQNEIEKEIEKVENYYSIIKRNQVNTI